MAVALAVVVSAGGLLATAPSSSHAVSVRGDFTLGGTVRPVSRSAPAEPTPAYPELRGAAAVVDGDTLEIDGERIRLEGIDAPEAGQSCKGGFFGSWSCGKAATGALRRMVSGRETVCENHGRDKYGRVLGVCFAGGAEINAAMVRSGHAWAFVKYSTRYVEAEAEARAARRGIFANETETAWEYRAGRWAGAEQKAPEGCAIKGNITRNGQIYHMPWSPWYAKVSIEEDRGERWFCSEKDAIAAGWRPAQGS